MMHIQNKNVVTVRIEGDMDHHNTKRIKTELNEAIENKGVTDVILDMSEITFMDSSGIGILLGYYKKLKMYSIKLHISSLPKSIERIIELAGLFTVIDKI